MKKFSIFLAITLLLGQFSAFAKSDTVVDSQTVTVLEKSFPDVPNYHDYYVPISFLTKIGVFKGYDDGTFKPENPINRAEVLKIILKSAGVAETNTFSNAFPDVKAGDWFFPYVLKAKEIGIVNGNQDGTFAPNRQVNLSEFLKMMLNANSANLNNLDLSNVAGNVKATDWFAPYVAYALSVGIISKDPSGNVDISKALTRGEVANMIYLLTMIKNANNSAVLLDQAKAQILQIDVYVSAKKVQSAKIASELAIDLTQQLLKLLPEDKAVLSLAKIAKAYDFLVSSFIFGIQSNYSECRNYANLAIEKANEAWEVDNSVQPIAKYIKDKANELILQVQGK